MTKKYPPIRRWRSLLQRGLGLAMAVTVAVTSVGCASQGTSGEEDKLVIGSVMPALNNEFWKNYLAFLEQTAEQLDIELININANESGEALANGVNDLIARGVDGIIAIPFYGTGPQILAAADFEGTPVMMVDALPEQEVPGGNFEQYVGFVGPDDKEAGYMMAEALADSIEPDANGTKSIVAIQGPPGTSVAENRFDGLEQYLEEHPDVELLGSAVGNFSPVDSQNAMDDLLQRHPEVQGLWSVAGGPTTGALSSIKAAGLKPGTDIKISTTDLNPDVLEAVEKGEVLFDIGGHWLEGGFGLVMLHDSIQGIEFTEEERTQTMSLLPVTQDTLDQFRADFPDGLPKYDAKEHSRHYTPDGPPAVIDLQYSEDVDLGLDP